VLFCAEYCYLLPLTIGDIFLELGTMLLEALDNMADNDVLFFKTVTPVIAVDKSTN